MGQKNNISHLLSFTPIFSRTSGWNTTHQTLQLPMAASQANPNLEYNAWIFARAKPAFLRTYHTDIFPTM